MYLGQRLLSHMDLRKTINYMHVRAIGAMSVESPSALFGPARGTTPQFTVGKNHDCLNHFCVATLVALQHSQLNAQ